MDFSGFTDFAKALFTKTLDEERERASSLLAKVTTTDRPVLEENLREITRLYIGLQGTTDAAAHARIQQELNTRLHTMEAIAVRYQIVAADEVRKFLTRMSSKALDLFFAAVDTVI